ncbi:MAG: exodeoxyribonuclease V subunit alpha [Xanthomonadales bacterium]|nr:exodeoxyribonuclease V subunit alpha [Xanthomonadales bacterium]
MSAAVLKRLRDAGLLREVDRALGELVLRRHPPAADPVREAVALAASLASRAVVAGHSGFHLGAAGVILDTTARTGSREPSLATIDADALLRESSPDAAAWQSLLLQSPWVGRHPDDCAPLCLPDSSGTAPEQALLQLRRYARHEQRVAEQLLARRGSSGVDGDRVAAVLASRFDAADPLDADPLRAARIALDSRLLILCGGPGTGKTHTVLRLLDAVVAADPTVHRIHLAAPTGKAASRLDDSLRQRLPAMDRDGRIAAALGSAGKSSSTRTLHRLLGLRSDGGQPRHHVGCPLPTDLLVVDEVSMVDLPLMARLLDALPPSARLLLIGDHDQLASVETGDVLSALNAAAQDNGPLSGHRVTLRHNHRFGTGSTIGRLAEAIRAGDPMKVRECLTGDRSLHQDGIGTEHTRVQLIEKASALHRRLHAMTDPCLALSLMDDERILCALRRGPLGADAINRDIDSLLIAAHGRLGDGSRNVHYPGRLLLIRENQPRLGLANGDAGVVLAAGDGRLEAWFRDGQGAPRALPLALLPAHQSAWALSVHQSQGSEYEHVDIVLGEKKSRVLGRQLLYTAVTRARRSLCLFAGPDVLETAIARRLTRVSGLSRRLRSGERGGADTDVG